METIQITQKIDISNYLPINNFQYSFKRKLAKEKYSYLCYHWNCKVLITIDKNNLLKIISNQNKESEETILLINNGKDHTCIKNSIEEVKNIKTEAHNIDLDKNLINNKFEKSLLWHISNLKSLILTKIQIKDLLQEQRKLRYEPDHEFLLNISNINISFSKTDALFQNLSICFSYQKFVNKKK